MINFTKRENSRKEFGFFFDYMLEKNILNGYFSEKKFFDNSYIAVKEFCDKEFNGEWISLEDLFLNDKFLHSEQCKNLLENLVLGLSYVPMCTLSWHINQNQVSDNFLKDDVFEHPELPYYYIIHRNNIQPWAENHHPFTLVEKSTGKYFPYQMLEVLPSNDKNIINGIFLHPKFKENIHLKFMFDIVASEDDKIHLLNEKIEEIKSLISVPEEYQSSIHISIASPINPSGTNVPVEIELLTDLNDKEFQNRIKDLILKKSESIDFLPF